MAIFVHFHGCFFLFQCYNNDLCFKNVTNLLTEYGGK